MKEKIEILLFGLFGLWIVLLPMIMIMKIKYFKTLRHKEYIGTSELFAFFSPEWWIAGLTLYFPVFGKDDKPELNLIMKKANNRLPDFTE